MPIAVMTYQRQVSSKGPWKLHTTRIGTHL